MSISVVRATASASQVELGALLSLTSNSSGAADSLSRLQTKEIPRARILVVEDNSFVREGIVSLINGQPDLCCCGEADSIASTPAAVANCKPDLVITDLRFKDGEAFGLMNFDLHLP